MFPPRVFNVPAKDSLWNWVASDGGKYDGATRPRKESDDIFAHLDAIYKLT